jgi:hypothetical protein
MFLPRKMKTIKMCAKIISVPNGQFKYFSALIMALCIVALPLSQSFGQTIPAVYLSQGEVVAIKAKLAAGHEPWTTAFNKLKADADGYLGQAALSVTLQGSSGNSYYTMKPYDWSNNMPSPCGGTHCDGYVNPKADRGDYMAAIKLGAAVRALGLGYAFTGNSKYADKAIYLIRAWALNPDTYMKPEVFTSQAIEQYVTFPGLFYGASQIWSYPQWSATEKQQFSNWAKSFAGDATALSYGNNWENWRQVFIASAGALTNDQTLLNHAFSAFKSVLSDHIGSDGRMEKELGRTLSFDYSMYALNAMTQAAEIARHHGVDLYGYTSSGRSLELAWDFHVPYLLNPASWPWEQIKAYDKDGVAIYELAYTRERKSGYMSVITKYGRPLNESRTMGPTTLTHSLGTQTTIPTPTPPTNVRVVR